MIYLSLLGLFIYATYGQWDITSFTCDAADTTDDTCSNLNSDPAIQLGINNEPSFAGLKGQTFVCSAELGFCTSTCANSTGSPDSAACDALATLFNAPGLVCDLENGEYVCTADLSCPTDGDNSQECIDKLGPSLSRCSGGVCVAPTPQPTTNPTTAEPTMETAAPSEVPTLTDPTTARPTATTPEPTNRPSSSPVQPSPFDCTGGTDTACAGEPAETWMCEYDVYGCQEAESQCAAYCSLSAQLDLARNFGTDVPITNDEAFYGACVVGGCPTSSPSVTPDEPVTTTVNQALLDCLDACPDTYEPVRCESNLVIILPCEQEDNECLAKCRIDAEAQALIADGTITEDLYTNQFGGVDGVFDSFCEPVCDEGALNPNVCENDAIETPDCAPTTTEDMITSTAETGDCDTDQRFWRTDCVEPDGDGCSALLEVTLDFCLMKGARLGIFSDLKEAAIFVLKFLTYPDYQDFCEFDELVIERYIPTFLNETVGRRLRRKGGIPKSAEDCIDIDALCGPEGGRNRRTFSLDVSVGFFCGDCATTKRVMLAVAEAIKTDEAQWLIEYGAKMLGLGIEGDTVCAASNKGFGLVEVDSATLSLRDEDGEVIDDAAVQKYCFIGLVIGFIMALY